MKRNSDKRHSNYSIFDNMSTETLEDILWLDAQQDIENDSEMILYIMEVVARREKKTGKYTETIVSWLSFEKNYMLHTEDNKSLYHYE